MPKKLKTLENTVILGGVGTGAVKLSNDASTEFSGMVKTSLHEFSDKTPTNVNPIVFAAGVKFEGENTFKGALLGNQPAEENKKTVYCKVKSFEQKFPFAEILFDNDSMKAMKLSLNAFNPTIVHNPIDSAIPAAFFEFDVINNGKKNAVISVGAVVRSFFSSGKASLGYDDKSGASYITLSEVSKSVSARRRGSISISTDSPDFTFETCEEADNTYFFNRFCKNSGFLSNNSENKNVAPSKNISAMLCCHAKLKAGEQKKIRIVVSWCFPYSGDGTMKASEKNYYFHYFPDVLSCTTYSISHFERLKKESLFTRNLVLGSGMSENAKSILSKLLGCIKNPVIRRDSAGNLHGISDADTEKCPVPVSFGLEYMFPGITSGTTERVIKSLISAKGKRAETGDFVPSAYDTDCNLDQIYARLMMLVRLYREYRNRSELKFFSENWVDISCMADMLCRSAFCSKPEGAAFIKTYTAVICTMKAMMDVAEVLVDKKRKIHFLDLYNCARSTLNEFLLQNAGEFNGVILSTRYLAKYMCGMWLYEEECVRLAAENVSAEDTEIDFYTCASLEDLGYTDKCSEILDGVVGRSRSGGEFDLYDKAAQCAVLLPAFSGFDYDKNTMTVSFRPDENFSDNEGTFKGFISFDEAYGYVEQGLDYIEIILLSGEVKIRKINCPHTPYKVMYGGRLWPCDIDGKKVTLDSNLAVTKNKKLTVLIDMTK